jgi:hypothetical protein
MPTNPQQSEVHESTADASTSPTAGQDQQTTRQSTPGQREDPWPDTPQLIPDPPSDVQIVRDDTDDAGPLIIKSTDPDLNPPRAPKDPFPTLGKPEIDPPVR